MTADALAERMRALRGLFLEALANDIPEVASAIERGDRDAALSVVHKIAGRAGTFGFAEVSDRASELEGLLGDGADARELRDAMAALEIVGRGAAASVRA